MAKWAVRFLIIGLAGLVFDLTVVLVARTFDFASRGAFTTLAVLAFLGGLAITVGVGGFCVTVSLWLRRWGYRRLTLARPRGRWASRAVRASVPEGQDAATQPGTRSRDHHRREEPHR